MEPLPRLPDEFSPLLARVISAMDRVGATRAELSPYTTLSLKLSADRLQHWLRELASTGRLTGVPEMFALLEQMQQQAMALLTGQIDFPSQLRAHLSLLSAKLTDAVDERVLTPELAKQFEGKIDALAARGEHSGPEMMAKLFDDAAKLESAVGRCADEGRLQRHERIAFGTRA